MAETLYKFFDARVLEWENLVEAANNHQTILIYVSSMRLGIPMLGIQMTQSMAINQYTVDP
jgi:hypothetical protein